MDPMYLTEKDRGILRAWKPAWVDEAAYFQGYDIEVSRFVDPSLSAFSLSPFLRWLSKGLEIASDSNWHEPRDWRLCNTREALVEEFERLCQRAHEEEIEWWKDDPAGYAQSCKREVSTEPPKHPWGEDVVARAKRWLALSPFQVYMIYQEVQGKGRQWLDDNLLDFVVFDGESASFKMTIHEFFEKLVADATKE